LPSQETWSASTPCAVFITVAMAFAAAGIEAWWKPVVTQ
jgi:hypothetical protein